MERKDFKLTIQLNSPLFTPLRGDTLFGSLLWQILYLKGESFLGEFIKNSKETPSVFISSGFPTGYLPFPVMDIDLKTLKDKKKYKKVTLLPLNIFQKYRENFNPLDVLQEIINNENQNQQIVLKNIRPHNSISRETGMTLERGGLYFTESIEETGAKFDIYLSTLTDYRDLVLQCIQLLGETGYGRDSSTGGGSFKIINREETSLLQMKDSFTHGFTLSPVVPSSQDSTSATYTLSTRYGKTGMGVEGTFLKKPFLQMNEGAVFKRNGKDTVGLLLEGIHTDPKVVHSAYSPLLGFKLKE